MKRLFLSGLLISIMGIQSASAQENIEASAPPLNHDVFCQNIQNKAQDMRFALQIKKMQEISLALSQKIDVFEKKKADLEKWLQKREQFVAKAQNHLVEIYTSLKPEAAALQLSALDDTMAVALLSRMNTRVASLILNEVEPTRAAQFTKLLMEFSGSPSHSSSSQKGSP